MKTAQEIFEQLNSIDENVRIDAKRASGIDKSIMETVCAFANEPGLGGGYLLLGAVRTGFKMVFPYMYLRTSRILIKYKMMLLLSVVQCLMCVFVHR